VTPAALGELAHVAILRALPGLGDLLCSMPALRAVRRAYPDARITLIGLPSAQALVARFAHYVDELLPFPGFPGIPEMPVDPARTTAFLARAQARRFDLAVQLHGSGQATNPFIALLGARRSAGFVLPGFASPDPELFLPYPTDQPEPLRHLALMRFLGLPADDPALEFPLVAEDRAEAERLLGHHGVVGPYACVNVGAAQERRRWPSQRFAEVADGLAERDLTPVLVGAPGEEPLTAATAALMEAPAADLAGATSLGGLAAVLRRATVTVTNDTGTSHLAAALGAPSVVVFSASDPRRWAPLDGGRHRALGVLSAASVEEQCTRCLRDGCRRWGDPVVGEVTPADVLAQCDELLPGDAMGRAGAPEPRAPAELDVRPAWAGPDRARGTGRAWASDPARSAAPDRAAAGRERGSR
jgi:ADP-heptose:LPS heptosyltransferase